MNPNRTVKNRPRSRSGAVPRARARRLAAAVLAASLVSAITGRAEAAPAAGAEVQVGQTLADGALLGLNGPNRRLSDFRGKPLVINVWASWCGPCRQEMASLERLAWKEKAVPFTLIGISTDDYPDKALQFLGHSNATISHFIDRDLRWEKALGASRLPLTVLVDAKGRIVEKVYGAQQWDAPQAQALIEKSFKQPASAPR